MRQERDDAYGFSDEWTESSAAFERVISDVENLVSNKAVPLEDLQKDAQRQSRYLSDLNALLKESRRVLQNLTEIENESELLRVDTEFNVIKQKIIELKMQLSALNRQDASRLKRCMDQLDAISFEKQEGFSTAERQMLEQLYTKFKDSMRSGEDGAVSLMQLVHSIREMKEEKSAEEKRVIESLERETLTHVFDIYASLFPLDIEEKSAALMSGRSARQTSLNVLSKRPAPVEVETWKGGDGGGSGGSDDGGSNGGDSDSHDEENRNGGIAWAFWLSIGFLLLAVLTVIFLPKDRTRLKEKLGWNKLKSLYQKLTGTEPPPPPVTSKSSTRRGKKRK